MNGISDEYIIADRTVHLLDGRAVGVLQAGDASGFPIFHFHGSGSSRLEAILLAAEAARQGVRLIGVDRPGIGLSDMQTDYPVLEWPEDVREIANNLRIDEFSVMGISAGSPYALACAHRIPDRLVSCGLVSSLSPGDILMQAGPIWMRSLFWIGKHMLPVFKLYLHLTVTDSLREKAASGKYLDGYASWLADADKAVLANPQTNRILSLAMAESYRQGVEASREAAITLSFSWGFRPQDVNFEHIYLWHGEKDRLMGIAPTRLFAESLPHCTATYYPEEGHFSTTMNHAAEILSSLKQTW